MAKRTLGQTIQLFGLQLLVKWRNLFEEIQVIYRYYWNRKFREADLVLKRQYLFQNPYRLVRQFFNADTYGETWLTSLQSIAEVCDIRESDVVFDLGCGRARTCFWLNAFRGCHVVGVELVPEFVDFAEEVNGEGVEFRCEDILETDLTGATVIYLYGTCYDDQFIEKLTRKFEVLPLGTKVISVSYGIESDAFQLVKKFSVPFVWGMGEVYFQIRK